MNNNVTASFRETFATVFNLGFRQGANDRAAAGVRTHKSEPDADAVSPKGPPPPNHLSQRFQNVWKNGYLTGYKIGASDDELASATIPGAHGMISRIGPDMLELMGFFQGEDGSESE